MCWWQGALDEGRALGHGLGAVAQQPYWKGWQAPTGTRANNVLALQGRRTPGWATGADKGPPGCCHPCCLVQGRPHLGATSSSGMPGERDVEMIRGVRAVPALRGGRGQCWAAPARLPGAQGCVQPHSRAGQQQVLTGSSATCFSWSPELSLPHVFGSPWQSLGRSVVGRAIPHVRVSEPSGLRRRPPVAACSCLALVQCPEFPFRMIPGSAAGPGSPGSRSEVLAVLGRDPRSPQVQRHHPDQSLRLPSVYLRVFHGTSPAAVPRGCSGGNRLCSGSAPWLRPGARLSKYSECASRRERKGEERRGRPSELRMK